MVELITDKALAFKFREHFPGKFREEVSPTDMTTYTTTYGWRSVGVRRGLMTSPL
jgi:hypothetical protein